MTTLVTGSAGHLGEALIRVLREQAEDVVGIDINASPFTDAVGSIADRNFVRSCFRGVNTVLHAATLHKPHVATHSMQDFVDTNITGTLVLLEEAVRANVARFVFTSTTSVFGDALRPPPEEPAAWVTEDVVPIPKNIYGVTKLAAENLCQLFHRREGLPCLVLRTSRFFPEEDDNAERRNAFTDDNLKANEFLHRRVELEDVVSAHLCAVEHAERIGFDRFIVSATTPFLEEDVHNIRRDAAAVIEERMPSTRAAFGKVGWQMYDSIDRIYVNAKARRELGWRPRYDFASVVEAVSKGHELRSQLAIDVGSKGYHAEVFADGPYPVENA